MVEKRKRERGLDEELKRSSRSRAQESLSGCGKRVREGGGGGGDEDAIDVIDDHEEARQAWLNWSCLPWPGLRGRWPKGTGGHAPQSIVEGELGALEVAVDKGFGLLNNKV